MISGAPVSSDVGVPLAGAAEQALRSLARMTASPAIGALGAVTLLCERARLRNMLIGDRVSANGRCHLFKAIDDTVALNLARDDDVAALPALLECDDVDIGNLAQLRRRIGGIQTSALLQRGRMLGLPIAAMHSDFCTAADSALVVPLHAGVKALPPCRAKPRVLDLSALWAGPLATHLLWLAGARVVKVESRRRPDAMRAGDHMFYALLNQGKASVVLDFNDAADRQALRSLIATSDIVIEASRPRALQQLGIDAEASIRACPGLIWLTITAHGASGAAAQWVGFGDDCGVAGGLSAAMLEASGRAGFVGDAIADPLTGIFAAVAAWEGWQSRRGGRLGLAMSQVVAHCLAVARQQDSAALTHSLIAWSTAVGSAFPAVPMRPIGDLPAWGRDTTACLGGLI